MKIATSGPLSEFGNAQGPATGPRRGALRQEWHALSKKCIAELAQLSVTEFNGQPTGHDFQDQLQGKIKSWTHFGIHRRWIPGKG
jgi:hypothetical protein